MIRSENNIPYPQWDDIPTSGLALRSGASAPGLSQVDDTGLYVYAFDGVSTLEQIYGSVELHHDWQVGTTLFPHIHWMPMTGGTGIVRWHLEYQIQSVGQAFGGSTLMSVISPATGVTFLHVLAPFGGIEGTSQMINSVMNFRIYRDPTDEMDNYGADAGMLQFGIHYLKDGLGSATQSSK